MMNITSICIASLITGAVPAVVAKTYQPEASWGEHIDILVPGMGSVIVLLGGLAIRLLLKTINGHFEETKRSIDGVKEDIQKIWEGQHQIKITNAETCLSLARLWGEHHATHGKNGHWDGMERRSPGE